MGAERRPAGRLRALFTPGRALLVALVGLSGLRLAFAASAELSPDEAYYWVWSRDLAAGYFDHPPLVAYLVRLGTWLLGDGALGVRAPAVLCALLAAWLVLPAVRRLTDDGWLGFWMALLASAAPVMSAGAVIHTPDSALAAAWMLALVFALRAFDRDRLADWLGLGAAAGLAALAKHSGLLLLPGLVLFFLSCKHGRARLRSAGPVWAVLVAALMLAPNVLWDMKHAGGALSFQLGHAAGELMLRPLGLLELVGGQAGVLSPLLWLGLVAFMLLGWRRAVRFGRPQAYLMWCLSGPLLLGFTLLSIVHKVEANWPAVAYLAAVPGAAWGLRGGLLFLRRFRLWYASALGLAVGISLVAHIHALAPFLPLEQAVDPTARLRGWQALGEQALADARALDACLAAEGYAATSELRYVTRQDVIYEPSSARRSQYDIWAAGGDAAAVKADGCRSLLVLQPRSTPYPPRLCKQAAERWLLDRDRAPGHCPDFRWWVCVDPLGLR
ncbi:MAG: glycosyltransferase family 39 protein [Deltaproteobacteria bacterium]|nr:glycosyltransferase family 39 protein [Deltaproteobacteria bacterium]